MYIMYQVNQMTYILSAQDVFHGVNITGTPLVSLSLHRLSALSSTLG